MKNTFKQIRNTAIVFIVVGLVFYAFFGYYEVIFSRSVSGVVTAVEKINVPITVLSVNGQDPSAQIFSFAVGIKDLKTGEIITASSEDRQWAVVRPGQCAEARYFPYPPWVVNKWGTYHNARLDKLSDCAAP